MKTKTYIYSIVYNFSLQQWYRRAPFVLFPEDGENELFIPNNIHFEQIKYRNRYYSGTWPKQTKSTEL